MKTSARNALRGEIEQVEVGAVNREILLELAPGKTITSTITRKSADTLGLEIGKPALAPIKASHVILAVQ